MKINGNKMVTIRIKRAQAGLEFLTTYAWAFVVILIIIGALAYFGVTNPSRILPDRCAIGSEFSCQNYILDDTNNKVFILLKNNLGEVVNITSFAINTEDGRIPLGACSNDNPLYHTASVNNYWRPGTVVTLNATCDLTTIGFVPGQKEKVTFTFNYYDLKSGPAYSKQISGEVFSTVR